MPSLLHYQIVTDPPSLQASLPGEPSVGTVYIIVSNTHQSPVDWEYIDVEVPLGTDPSDLSNDVKAVVTSYERTITTPRDDTLEFKWDSKRRLFRAQFDWTQTPTRRYPELIHHGALILKLENIPLTEGSSLVHVKIHDKTKGGDNGPPAMGSGHFTTTLGLVKQTPRVPRNFRAEKSLVDGDAGEQLALLWDGPTDLDYWILDQRGNEVHHEQAKPGPAAHLPFRPRLNVTPKRGTTYTLVAKPRGVAHHQGYFLTTTVHATIPEFEGGTRTQWIEGTANKGRAVFTSDGVDVQAQNHSDLGRLRAKTADVDSVITRLVQGRKDEDGWITFPERGVNVYHGRTSTPGVITAARADVDGVNTTWAGSRDAGQGWIEFSQPGVTVHKDGTQDRGTLSAEKVDVNGLNTKWVGDLDGGKGWIEFPQYGVEVHQDGSSTQGTLRADSADISNGVNTSWVGDRAREKGWIEFPEDGIDVRKEDDDWGTVAAGLASLNDARVKGLLTVLGGMNLSHKGEKMFNTMPDRIWVSAQTEFKQTMKIVGNLFIDMGKSGVSMTKADGMLVSGCNFQLQQGELSISTGNPPQVRKL
ncbi:hypothetical protein E0500_000170 [Streptomyces sp. KM273126]|uniref:hypothetical protein n=1 Tax=Streptomyces sp. KM273126 TaxID=2545247 RepID=UPI00103ACC6F|nr:hypothetical protein [Streptomyces sp. KM273126]MBA2805927.1 hypothetical protein [Streptomyces sp. KM273126]